jgi:hypothetical protein
MGGYDVCRMDETVEGWTRLIYSEKDEKNIRGQICKMKKQIKYSIAKGKNKGDGVGVRIRKVDRSKRQ